METGNSFRKNATEVSPNEPTKESVVHEEPPKPESSTIDDIPQEDTGRYGQRRERKGSPVSRLLKGDLLKDKKVVKQIPLILLVAFYLILLVANRYKVEQLNKEKIATEENINFLREHRIQMQKEYQECIKISRIANELDTLGVGLISGPPYEL